MKKNTLTNLKNILIILVISVLAGMGYLTWWVYVNKDAWFGLGFFLSYTLAVLVGIRMKIEVKK